MRGFLRRDLCLLRFWGWVCLVMLAAMFALARAFSRVRISGNLVYFILTFGMETLYLLATYDGMGGWLPYAAAIPGGRKQMVDERYFLALCVALVLAAVLFLQSLLWGEALPLWTAGYYTAAFFFLLSVNLPICFRWGYTGSGVRLAIILLTFVPLGVMGGLFSGVLQEARADLARGALRADAGGFFSALAGLLPLLGLGTLALSWRVSRRIMEKKEF